MALRRSCGGRRRKSLLDGSCHLYILEGEAKDVLQEMESMTAETRRWQEIAEKRDAEVEALLQDMAAETTALSRELEERESELRRVRESTGSAN